MKKVRAEKNVRTFDYFVFFLYLSFAISGLRCNKKDKIMRLLPKTGQKKAETDTNSRFMGLRAEMPRLQGNVTCPKKVKYGK